MKLVVQRSNEPEDDKTHVLNLISETKNGCNYQMVFKGTYSQCLEEKRKRLGVENGEE